MVCKLESEGHWKGAGMRLVEHSEDLNSKVAVGSIELVRQWDLEVLNMKERKEMACMLESGEHSMTAGYTVLEVGVPRGVRIAIDFSSSSEFYTQM